MDCRATRKLTLVELMVVVAIVALLAAIAIPKLAAMQLRAKRAEAAVVLDGVGQALTSHEQGSTFTADDPCPRGDAMLDRRLVPWPVGSAIDGCALLDTISFRPDGDVRCNYLVRLELAPRQDAVAQCDVNDDGGIYRRRLTRDFGSDGPLTLAFESSPWTY